MNNENEFLDWNGTFVAEENSFTLLPAGEYPFQVIGMERKNYDGPSEKIPNGAPYAEVEMKLVGAEGETTVKERLYLLKKFSWKLTQFFTAIGQAPVVGQPFSPNWQMVIGSQGTAKVSVNTYQKDGQEKKNNRIDEFLKPAANAGTFGGYVPPQQNTMPNQQQPTQQQTNGYNPGAF